MCVLTMYPGEGITGITADNPDAMEEVKVSWIVGATSDPTVTPPFWAELWAFGIVWR